jgi:hypothetical protein
VDKLDASRVSGLLVANSLDGVIHRKVVGNDNEVDALLD